MTAPLQAMTVVVPVHDEEELLGACLESLHEATAQLRRIHDIDCDVWVVLDACRDGSRAVAEHAGVRTLSLDVRNVGRSRAAGVAAALAHVGEVDPARVWTAHTDADSVVPAHWLTHQHELADAGADVMIGTVRPDFRDLDAARTAAWWQRYRPGVANDAVHGANLGVRADALVRAGGFPALDEHEDVELVDALRRGGARIVLSDGAWVRTSGRQTGRTPGGYARYLRDDLLTRELRESVTD
ncbi:glycosyltransferase [Microbacterium sp. NPDC089189]|uniref:glycosyltransferase n=1 Tax=Microbacterium sp. NPDC089189 TaxID=3154972 RepID=UPI0034305FD2